jgi:hypothetical protein
VVHGYVVIPAGRMMADYPDSVPMVSLEDRVRLEAMGEAYVNQLVRRHVTPTPWHGSPDQFTSAAVAWLAELDAKRRDRAEALQSEQTLFNRSTLRVAWIAAIAAIVAVVVGILAWCFPLH